MLRCANTSEVVNALEGLPDGVIAVDGFQGSGKTTLAKQLGKALGRDVIGVDAFLNRNRGSFYIHLDLTKLSTTIAERQTCILEGICCLQVLQAIEVRPTSLVYVKRMAVWGWADEDELNRHESSKDASSEPIAVALRNLWDEVASYHALFRPHELANILYERSAA